MPANAKKENIRSVKTERALNAAMFLLLQRYNFRKITVRDICEEALLSRATFYVHFTDKYDFMKWWIINAWPDDMCNLNDGYEAIENRVNRFANENKTIIRNLFTDADHWTLDALFDALHFILHMTPDKTMDGLANPKHIVLSNFYIGGMISYISWQVKNDFPQNVELMNEHLNEIVKAFQGWTARDGGIPYAYGKKEAGAIKDVQ